jgi:hypothetical protein
MRSTAKRALCVGVLLGVLTPAADAAAQCCPNYSVATSCASANLTKSRWCIANDAPSGNGTATLPSAFCSYGDQVVSTLEQVFNIQAPGTFEFDVETNGMGGPTGGAQTPTVCGTFGNAVTYDAFTGSAYNATGFWGYLLSLHEAINQWTGLASGGWPTDWWADHQSAFPNLMDFHVMNLIGTTNNDNNLLTAAAAQKARFYPGGDSADAKVVALDNVYGMMPNGDGLAGFSHVFALVQGDTMSWGNLGNNPNQKLSEYVVSYMALAVGQNGGQVLQTVQGPSANQGGNICNGTSDGQDPTYVCSESDVDAIATAHCAVAANGRDSADLTAFHDGNATSVKMGPCGSTCPAECGCDTSTMNCVAPWLATNGGSSSSSGSASGSSSGSTGGSTGGSTSSSGGGTSGSTSGSGGSSGAGAGSSTSSGSGGGSTSGGSSGSTGSSSGGSASTSGSSSGSTGGTSGTSSGSGGTSSGSTSSGSASGGSSTSSGGTPGGISSGSNGGSSGANVGGASSGSASASGGSSGSADSSPFTASDQGGCSCRALGAPPSDSRTASLFSMGALLALALVRERTRKR